MNVAMKMSPRKWMDGRHPAALAAALPMLVVSKGAK
jgi:hypothetical protein